MRTFYSVHLCSENVDINYTRIESSIMNLEIQIPIWTKKNVTKPVYRCLYIMNSINFKIVYISFQNTDINFVRF